MAQILSGLENLVASGARDIRGMRIGLLTNPCGIDSNFRTSIEVINELDFVQLVALYGPEHGIRGEVQAGDHVSAEIDQLTELPIFSLYGETRVPTGEMLGGIDALIVDFQDIGVRYATYFSTLDNVMTACHQHGKQVIILDRPNPLGGETVQGGLLREEFRSFIGTHTVPVMHGMTLGELGLMLAEERKITAPIVVPMIGWSRSMLWDETGLPWVLPSPNLPTLDSHIAYPGTCLIEGTSLSEGRGTTRPFEMIGAPWVESNQFAKVLNASDFPGIRARPVYFGPAFSKHAGKRCGGVQVYVDRSATANLVEYGVHLLRTLASLYPDNFDWADHPDGENRSFIDLLTGSDDVRKAIDSGAEMDDLFDGWRTECAEFRDRRAPFLLYDSVR